MLRMHLSLAGKEVLDVGCGDGSLVRLMTRQGAQVTGLEPSPGQLARARAAEPEGGERYLQGGGEALPLPDGSLDIVVFFNSLHHIPVAVQRPALLEAHRVLRPGGLVYILEPIAEGKFFQLMQPIEDETEVRAKALAAVHAVVGDAYYAQDLEQEYLAPLRYKAFEDFIAGILAVDQARQSAVDGAGASLRESFEALAEQRDGEFLFETPARLNLLRRLNGSKATE